MPNKLYLGLALVAATLITGCASDEDAYVPEPLPEIDNKFEPKTLWTNSLSGVGEHYNKLRPAMGYGHVYAADADGDIAAYDMTSGKQVWSQETELELAGGIGLGSGLVVVGSIDGDVVTFDAKTGEKKWATKVSSEVLAPPAIGDGHIVVQTVDGKIFALSETDGGQRWFYDRVVPSLTLRGTSTPIIERGAAIASFANGKVGVFILQNGQLAWEKEISVASGRSELARMVDADTTPVTFGDTLYAANYNGNLMAVTLRTGEVEWKRDASSYQDIAVDAQLVYLVDAENVVRAFERSTGTPYWQNAQLKYRQLTAPVLFNGYLVVGDYEGYLHWIDPKTGDLHAINQVDSDGIVANPVTDGNMLVVYARSGDLEVYSAK